MFLLGLIQLNFAGSGMSDTDEKAGGRPGYVGGLVLGHPLRPDVLPGLRGPVLRQPDSPGREGRAPAIVLPGIYGVGTALPVLVFAVLMAVSAQSVGKAFNSLSRIEWWVRRITGVVFLLVGLYYTLKFVFDVI